MAAKMYGKFLLSMAHKEVNLSTDTIKAMLVTSAYTPNQDTDQYKSAVTNEVANGNGYATGGATCTSVTCTYDGPSNTLTLDGVVPAWAASTITARYIVFYDDTPATDATKSLIMYDDFTTDKISSNGTWTYTVNAAGIVGVTAA